MSDSSELLSALRRIEKGELLVSHPVIQGGTTALRRKSETSDYAVSSAFDKLRSRKSSRIAPIDVISLPATVVSAAPVPKIPPPPPLKAGGNLADQSRSMSELSSILSATHGRAKGQVMQQLVDTHTALHEAQKIIPASFMQKYEMHQRLKREAIDRMFVVCAKMRQINTRAALKLWRVLACEITFKMWSRAAITINTMIRGFLARRRVIRVRMDLQIRARHGLFEKHAETIVRVQRWARRCIARHLRKQRAAMIQASKHAEAVDRALRLAAKAAAADAFKIDGSRDSTKSRLAATRLHREAVQAALLVKEYGSEHVAAAIKIQSMVRMRLGYLHVCRVRAQTHRAKMQRRLEAPGEVRSLYFEHHGAAYMIQKWYLRLPTTRMRRRARRRAVKHKMLVGKATLIQRVWRGTQARRRVKVLRAIHDRAMLRKNRAAVLLQAAVRRYRVRKRLTKQQRRKLDKWTPGNRKNSMKKIEVQRRPSISFPHLIIKDLEYINTMDAAAKRIQRKWKRWKMQRKLETATRLVVHPAAARIARWLRSWLWRRRRNKAVRLIQRAWRRKLDGLRRKRRAAIEVRQIYICVYVYTVHACVRA
jgi:hypothetical protein